jgi:hypothetical protein
MQLPRTVVIALNVQRSTPWADACVCGRPSTSALSEARLLALRDDSMAHNVEGETS